LTPLFNVLNLGTTGGASQRCSSLGGHQTSSGKNELLDRPAVAGRALKTRRRIAEKKTETRWQSNQLRCRATENPRQGGTVSWGKSVHAPVESSFPILSRARGKVEPRKGEGGEVAQKKYSKMHPDGSRQTSAQGFAATFYAGGPRGRVPHFLGK